MNKKQLGQLIREQRPEPPNGYEARMEYRLVRLTREEKSMKKRYKFSTVLVAAVLVVAVLAGTAFAASILGIFDIFDRAEPIIPLLGAEEMVATNLGISENEYAILAVEEAVFDGQGILVQMRLTPKDENYVMYDAFSTSSPLVGSQFAPKKIEEGTQDIWHWTVVNEGNDKRLLENGVELEIPTSLEEAHEKDLPVYLDEGVLYDADQLSIVPTEPTDGRKLMDYRAGVRAEIDGMSDTEHLMPIETGTHEGQEDGSVIIRTSCFAEEPLNVDSIRIHCSAQVAIEDYDEAIELEAIDITLARSGEKRTVKVMPVGDGEGERFKILSGSIVFTKIRGYFNVSYNYEQAETGEDMGIIFNVYDAEGNEITTSSGTASAEPDENGICWCSREMQSFDEIPERIWIEAKVIGSSKTLGRVECQLVESMDANSK